MKPSAAAIAAVLVSAASLAAPAGAAAGLASITFRAVPLHGERTLQGSPGRFDLVGLRWHGSGSIRFSVHSTGSSARCCRSGAVVIADRSRET